MTDVSATVLVLSALYGLVGGVLFVVKNKLLEQKQYLGVYEHLGAGALVGVLAVMLLGYSIPNSLLAAGPIITAGYFAIDVLDDLAEKYSPTTAPKSAVVAK